MIDNFENLRLRHVARESIQQHRDVARRFGDHILDHGGDQFIGDELAGLHVALGGLTGLRALRDGAAQEVSRRDVLEVCVLGRELRRDRALARTGRTQQNDDIHNVAYYTIIQHTKGNPRPHQ